MDGSVARRAWTGGPAEIAAAARWLEDVPAEQVLDWAVARFAPRLAFATAFGPEGLVLLHLIASRRLPVDVFTLDTGLFFPETYALWRRLEARYGITVRAVRPHLSLDEQAARHGQALWERDPDRCCQIRKVDPLQESLAGHRAWITAIRRDQTGERSLAAVVEHDLRHGLVKVNPLLGWSSARVWAYLREHEVPTNPLHGAGYPSIGCWPCTSPVSADENPRAGRWRGRGKTECGLHLRDGRRGRGLESEAERS
ncbi:MAG TPA: phosphoadenylyl-sulfate reductase [Vicinamibacteria bacterium]|nr:phosphoadenylyl-sulfate reductase [Vicinamibacteria bacterium]